MSERRVHVEKQTPGSGRNSDSGNRHCHRAKVRLKPWKRRVNPEETEPPFGDKLRNKSPEKSREVQKSPEESIGVQKSPDESREGWCVTHISLMDKSKR